MTQAKKVPEEEEANVVGKESLEPKGILEGKVNQVHRVIQDREDHQGTQVPKEALGTRVILD